MTTYTYPLPPSANRYWRIYRGRPVVSQEARDYKEVMKLLAHRDRIQQLMGPVVLTVKVFREPGAGDLDNRLKILADALEGIFYANDSQIVELHAFQFDDKQRPRVEVEVVRRIDSR